MASTGNTVPQDPTNTEEGFAEEKGKGKALTEQVHEDTAMDEDDDDDDDDEEDEEEVRTFPLHVSTAVLIKMSPLDRRR